MADGLDIAAAGAGVSGLTVAAILSGGRGVTVFEAADCPGGHSGAHAARRVGGDGHRRRA